MAYNGWTNRETWLVNLWLRDGLVMEIDDGIEITPEYIEEIVEELVEENCAAGLLTDLLYGAIAEVNWHEIAEHYGHEEEAEE